MLLLDSSPSGSPMNLENAPLATSASSPEADQRIADLAVFANGVAHDIRNPLSVIRTSVYLLKQGASSQEERSRKALQRIDDQVNAALHLLNGIQALDRVRQPTFQRVSLNELARSVAASTNLPDEYRVELDLEEEVPLLDADPQLLEAALRALIRNSIEALQGGGIIRLRTRQTNGNLHLVVEDSGSGIPEEVLGRVFEPFFSTRRAHSGLGLPLASQVALAHHGRAWVNSLEGEGTRVTLEFPVHPPR